jgi:enterochelin esterase-like enzyme
LRGRFIAHAMVCIGLAGCGCRRDPPPTPATTAAPAASPSVGSARRTRELVWDYPATPWGPERVVVVTPVPVRPNERFPVLLVLHGMGEALKGPELGARGFVDDYWMPRALDRLQDPPLTREDLLDTVTDARLGELNAALAKQPFRGLVVVCPYTPRTLRGRDAAANAVPFADFLVDELLPRARRETPALATAAATGIDGVSLGGRGALLVGLARPEAFGVVSTLQPAFDTSEVADLVVRARAAVAARPSLSFRLVTSRRDFYLESTQAIAEAFRTARIPVAFALLEGDHSYEFNRGPGIFELLLFHDRALRGEPAP